MNSEETKYNNRQFLAMLRIINKYRMGKINSRTLIFDLYSLNDWLKNMEVDWKDEFMECWSAIDVKYGLASLDGRSDFNETEIEIVNKILCRMEKLIRKNIKTIN